jgi:5-methylcytosine-specific restriction enzyme A
MGLEGDQSLNFSQNKTLYLSNEMDITVLLFEVFEPGRYMYQGEVYLADQPYEEIQPDIKDTPRKVFVFPLKFVQGQETVTIPSKALETKEAIQERKARRLN